MKVLIIGCGKFGVRLAEYLTRKNHEIVVVDNDPETFHALGAEFTGRTICGVGYDKAVLEQAGVHAWNGRRFSKAPPFCVAYNVP